jgi:hypothetical protein
MTGATVLNRISFVPDPERLGQELHLPPHGGQMADLRALCQEAGSIAVPKAAYYVKYVDDRDERSVVLGGIRLTSRVLSVNLSGLHRAFPYAATCGTELARWGESFDGLLRRYMADMIMEAALDRAIEAMEADIGDRFHPGDLSEMNPGSLNDWPIEEQRPLFQLLAGAPASIGIHLKENLLMFPTKTVSGIKFASEIPFASCLLCPRENCRGRQAPYDPDLYSREYAAKSTSH